MFITNHKLQIIYNYCSHWSPTRILDLRYSKRDENFFGHSIPISWKLRMKLYYDTDEEDSYVIADQKMWGRKESMSKNVH